MVAWKQENVVWKSLKVVSEKSNHFTYYSEKHNISINTGMRFIGTFLGWPYYYLNSCTSCVLCSIKDLKRKKYVWKSDHATFLLPESTILVTHSTIFCIETKLTGISIQDLKKQTKLVYAIFLIEEWSNSVECWKICLYFNRILVKYGQIWRGKLKK